MRKFFTNFLVISGLIFWMLAGVGAYVFSGAPLPEAVRTYVEPVKEGVSEYVETAEEEVRSDTVSTGDTTAVSSDGPVSGAQADALKAFGIDPAAVSNVTPEQEACFERTLGRERVDAIQAGAVPGPGDYLKARECL